VFLFVLPVIGSRTYLTTQERAQADRDVRETAPAERRTDECSRAAAASGHRRVDETARGGDGGPWHDRTEGHPPQSAAGFILGSGPLERASDRVEVAGRIVVVLSLLVAPALAVVATGHLHAVAAEAAAERTLVHAVLCGALNAHREHRWAQGWAAVGPEWATRLL